jgi:hypothetical protein
MIDVTENLREYLEAKRHLWNVYFRGKVNALQQCPVLDEFEIIDRALFRSLVIQAVAASSDAVRRQLIATPWELLRVKLPVGLKSVRLAVSDPIAGLNRAWNPPERLELPEHCDFGFIEFFEWDRYGFQSFPLIRATIDNRSNLPALVNREVLIESSQLNIVLLTT